MQHKNSHQKFRVRYLHNDLVLIDLKIAKKIMTGRMEMKIKSNNLIRHIALDVFLFLYSNQGNIKIDEITSLISLL